jgi:hypothetical protein
MVDVVEVAVIPVLLGDGVPLLPPAAQMTRLRLRLTDHRIYPKTGTVALTYEPVAQKSSAKRRAPSTRKA